MVEVAKREIIQFLVFFFPFVPTLFYTLFKPDWFTSSLNTIDPWIYWGAGDNPNLTFANQFGETYYLQRYVVILPQIVFQSFFGPFYSQFLIALFWLTMIFLAIRLIVKDPISYILITTILCFDPTFMGMIGVSYTQAASIALMLTSVALAKRLIEIFGYTDRSSNDYRPSAFMLGSFLALLSNSYLLIFFFIAPAIVLSILLTRIRSGNARSKVYPISWIIFGSIVTLVFLQFIYWSITKSKIPYLFLQLKLGSDLTSNANPWGGGNGISQLIEKISNPIFSHWWLGCLILIFILFSNRIFDKNFELTDVQFFLTAVCLSTMSIFFIMHATYINPIGYSWSALVLLLPQIVGLDLYVKTTLDSFTRKKVWISSLLLSLLILAFFSKNLTTFFEVNLVKLDWFIISIIVISILSFFSLFLFSKEIRLRINSYLVFVLILTTISLRSIFLSYADDLSGIGGNPKRIYENLSTQRNTLQDLRIAMKDKYRIWLTPENSKPLLSSQLYTYSLISTVPGEVQCDQVSWAATTPALIVSFNATESPKSISKNYLEKCGFTFLEIPRNQFRVDNSKDTFIILGILQKLSD